MAIHSPDGTEKKNSERPRERVYETVRDRLGRANWEKSKPSRTSKAEEREENCLDRSRLASHAQIKLVLQAWDTKVHPLANRRNLHVNFGASYPNKSNQQPMMC